MFSHIKRLLQVPKSEDAWEQLTLTLLHRSFLIFIITASLLTLISIFQVHANQVRLPFILSDLFIVLFAFVLFQSGRTKLGGGILIIGLWLTLSFGALTSIGVYSAGYIFILATLLISAIVYGTKASISLTLMTFLLGGLMLFLHDNGSLTTPVGQPLSPFGMWLVMVCLFSIIVYVAIIVRSTVFKTFAKQRQNEAFYRAILEDQEEFIVRWVPGGIRTFANAAYCRYFDISHEEAIGTNFYPYINEDDRAWIAEKIARLSIENPIDIDEHRVIRPDGTTGWQQWSDRAIFDEKGNIVEYQSVGRDITAIKELEVHQQELNLAKEREAFLRDFLSSMSHDLQTPLSVMRTNLYMLQQAPQTAEDRIQRIDKQIEKLSSMIGDILHVARLEHLPELQRKPSAIAPILESSLAPLRDEAKAKNIRVDVTSVPSILIQADEQELQRALSNLISNAIKYTPQGGNVHIYAEIVDKQVRIEIKDSGIGIDGEDLPHIFERFFRAKNALNYEKGTGLGLAIVKRIVELHEGMIEASSAIGEGTAFSIRLPILAEALPA